MKLEGQNSEKNEKLTRIKEKQYIENGEEEIKWEFLNKEDLKSAYWIGLYYNLVDNLQNYYLKTRGLQKKLRALFVRMDKTKLLKIFHLCNEVMLKVQATKRLKSLPYKNIRSMIELSMKNDIWFSSSEELGIAFMYGFDASYRTYQKFKHLLVKNENNKIK